MKIAMKIQDICYEDVAVLALPSLEHRLPRNDTALSKLLRAIARLPVDVVHSLFDAIPQQEKNDMVSLLVLENKDRLQYYAENLLHAEGVRIRVLDLQVTKELQVMWELSEVNYAALTRKFPPLIQGKETMYDGIAAVLRELQRNRAGPLPSRLAQKKKKDIAIFSLPCTQQRIGMSAWN